MKKITFNIESFWFNFELTVQGKVMMQRVACSTPTKRVKETVHKKRQNIGGSSIVTR
jgi:hypothetical protein